MPVARDMISINELLPELSRLAEDSDRQEFLARYPYLLRASVVQQLAPLVVDKIQVDAREALRLAESVVLIARKLRRKDNLALALRAKANALYACGNNREAVEHHDQAYEIYASRRSWKEAARTLSNSIQPLILLGEYDRAFKASQQARKIFVRLGEGKRIASLENNVGNIFHRQDQFEQALIHYERAYEALAGYQQWEHAAAALSNMAMCLINLNDFPKSLDCYRKARELCVKYGLPRMRDQADYNIAYMHYLRGEYNRAIGMLFATRRACEASGDMYHFALCHLDLSEIYLELNLSDEAREMARQGFLLFQKLGMGYESAKTLANEAIACSQQGRTSQALEQFQRAREIFVQEKNLVWPWLLDLYQAFLWVREGRYVEARQLCAGAAEYFDHTPLSGKAALAHLLLAQIALDVGDLGTAAREGDDAVRILSGIQAPILDYQAHLLVGQIAFNRGEFTASYAACQQARQALEAVRTRLQGEELKISFVKNRLRVYELLVNLYLERRCTEISAEEAFGVIEAAKSRSMTEMIFQSGFSMPLNETEQSESVRKSRELREDLNWFYHRIELEQLRPEKLSRERIERLRHMAQSRENELLRILRELPLHERERSTLDAPNDFSLAKLRTRLPADTAVVEYYSAGDQLVVAVVTRESIEITPLTTISRLAHCLHLLRFQFSKFRMGAAYAERFKQSLLRTTWDHLEILYKELIMPVRPYFHARHLVFVPHGPLHSLPFHALRNGDEYLGDAYTISYAPSATVFAICQQKPTSEKRTSIVLGIPDERAPEILTEVESIAALLPNPQLYIGKQATAEILREKGAETGLVHIATHGMYRQDNPMFSGIRLGDGYLNLYDLYQMRLAANLITLSGCATGMNLVAAGDELLGLQRGLFYAGASSLLLSLWDVHDHSTALLMQEFYKNYMRTEDMARSLQAAMRDIRSENPHPYFWAPFMLVGKIAEKQALS